MKTCVVVKKLIRYDGPEFPIYKVIALDDATITPVQGFMSNGEKAIRQAYRVESKKVRMIAYLNNDGIYCQSISSNDHL